jgi:uncharacterized protein
MQMRVNIDEIKDPGLDRAWDLPREGIDEALRGDPAGYRAVAPSHVEAHLERSGRRVRFQAEGRAEVTAPCSRCLAPTRVTVPLELDLSLVPADEDAGEESAEVHASDEGSEGSFTQDEVDEERYRGKVIDLDPLVQEQLLLSLPAYPVCQEECKGLCAVCGQNLNEKDCGCDRHVPDPRWAGLAKFRRE